MPLNPISDCKTLSFSAIVSGVPISTLEADVLPIAAGTLIVNPPHTPRGGHRIDQFCGPFEQIRLLMIKMHDAFFRLAAGTLLGLGDIGRGRDEDLAAARMSGRLPGVVVGADLSGEIGPAGMAHRGKDRHAAATNRRKGIGGAGGDADRRLGFWYGFGTRLTSLKW